VAQDASRAAFMRIMHSTEFKAYAGETVENESVQTPISNRIKRVKGRRIGKISLPSVRMVGTKRSTRYQTATENQI
jgi:hypothetical protein